MPRSSATTRASLPKNFSASASPKQYKRLSVQDASEQPKAGVLQPTKVEPGKPKQKTGLISNHVVKLLNKRNNRIVEVGYRAACFLEAKYKDQYQIVS